MVGDRQASIQVLINIIGVIIRVIWYFRFFGRVLVDMCHSEELLIMFSSIFNSVLVGKIDRWFLLAP